MRRIRASVLAAVILVAVAFTASIALAATKPVTVRKSGTKYLFAPNSLSIRKGDTARWSWRGSVPHNVTGRGFHSRTASRLTYSHTFRRAGTFRVVCTIHAGLGQRMTVRVR
jgi:plastocyanin